MVVEPPSATPVTVKVPVVVPVPVVPGLNLTTIVHDPPAVGGAPLTRLPTAQVPPVTAYDDPLTLAVAAALIELIWNGPVPVLCSMNVPERAAVPVPKLYGSVVVPPGFVMDMFGTPTTPVPLSDCGEPVTVIAFAGVPVSVAVTVTLDEAGPVAVGLKVTRMLQPAPAAKVPVGNAQFPPPLVTRAKPLVKAVTL